LISKKSSESLNEQNDLNPLNGPNGLLLTTGLK
jgi:hypothetical protein